jgi:ferredoxin
MRITIDPDLCQGHTLCHMAAPALFQLREEDGHACVVVDEVPPGSEELARKVVLGCPEGAISLQ